MIEIPAPIAPIFRKSNRSGNGGNCVEVATNLVDVTGEIHVRDSKNPEAGVQVYSKPEWDAFIGGVRDGDFDI